MRSERDLLNKRYRLKKYPPGPPQYSGFIIIRLSPTVPLIKGDDLRQHYEEVPGVAKVLLDNRIPTRRVVRSVSPEKLLKMEKRASVSSFPPLHSLTSYWRLDCRNRETAIEKLLKHLQDLPEVELAYHEKAALDPSVTFSDDIYSVTQNYLDAAPVGINARWTSTFPHGIGSGVGFVDLEQSWNLNHEDLVASSATLIFNDNRSLDSNFPGDHGTAVLGEILATDNSKGIVGIAPGVTSFGLVSHYHADSKSNGHVADAICAAVNVMNHGDVLLLEVERDFLPTESDPADFDAIRLAVGLKEIVVIEAAGNGALDLDAWVDHTGTRRFDRRNPDFDEFDSGAIMVGACEPLSRTRQETSNFGSRVDCFAWGDSITTAGEGDLDSGTNANNRYTESFGGTSGAAAIIAGAALVIQGMSQVKPSTRFMGVQMRAVLSNHQTGTSQEPDNTENIGVMPNLQAIVEDFGI
jgi:hypothetical protein